MGAKYEHAKRQQIIGSSHTLATNGTAQYVSPVGRNPQTGNIWEAEQIFGRNGILRYAYGRVSTPPGGVTSRTFTLYLNGAPTAITFTITGAAQDGIDLQNEVAITPYDEVAWHSDGGVGVPVAAIVYLALGFFPY